MSRPSSHRLQFGDVVVDDHYGGPGRNDAPCRAPRRESFRSGRGPSRPCELKRSQARPQFRRGVREGQFVHIQPTTASFSTAVISRLSSSIIRASLREPRFQQRDRSVRRPAGASAEQHERRQHLLDSRVDRQTSLGISCNQMQPNGQARRRWLHHPAGRHHAA